MSSEFSLLLPVCVFLGLIAGVVLARVFGLIQPRPTPMEQFDRAGSLKMLRPAVRRQVINLATELISRLRSLHRPPQAPHAGSVEDWNNTEAVVVLARSPASDACVTAAALLPDSVQLLFLKCGAETPDLIVSKVTTDLRVSLDTLGKAKSLLLHPDVLAENLPVLWIYCPEWTVSDDEFKEFFPELQREVRSILAIRQLVIEVFCADHLRLPSLRKAEIPASQAPSPDILPAGARYAAARKALHTRLQHGALAGFNEIQVLLRIPSAVLESRDLGVAWSWDKTTCVSICGPSASGKTDLALMLAEAAIVQKKIVVAVTPSSSTAKAIRELPADGDLPSILKRVLEAVTEAPFEDFPLDPIEYRAFKDELSTILQRTPDRLVLYADDLHERPETAKALERLRKKTGARRFRYLLCSRTSIDNFADEAVHVVKMSLWNREQARQILDAWTPKEMSALVAAAFTTGWLVEQRQFPSDLLRVMRDRLDSLQESPARLILGSVEALAQNMAKAIPERREITPDLLATLRARIESGAAHAELLALLDRPPKINAVRLIGQLSWMSRFREQSEVLTLGNVRDWSSNVIQDEHEARALIDAGREVGLFKGDNRDIVWWFNKTAADACAALYLDDEIPRWTASEQPTRLLEILNRLSAMNSLTVLSPILRDSLFLLIIRAIATKPENIGILEELIKDGALEPFRRNQEAMDQFAWAILQMAEDTPARTRRLGRILADFVIASSSVRRLMEETIGRRGAMEMLSLVTLARCWGAQSAYFEHVRGRVELASAARGAALAWDGDGFDPLRNALREFVRQHDHPPHRDPLLVRAIWCEWLTYRSHDEQFDILRRLVQGMEPVAEVYSLHSELIRSTLSVLRGGIRRLLPQDLRAALALVAVGTPMAIEAVRTAVTPYLAAAHLPEVLAPDMSWIFVTPTVALPQHPLEQKQLKVFMPRITRDPHLTIPTSSQLRARHEIVSAGPELVSDAFPTDWRKRVTELAMGEWFQVLDNGQLRFVKNLTEEVWWRPALRLDD